MLGRLGDNWIIKKNAQLERERTERREKTNDVMSIIVMMTMS